jgi:hypothetical protein
MRKKLMTLFLMIGLFTSMHAQEHIHVSSLVKLNKSFIIVNSDKYMLSSQGVEDYVEGIETPAWSFVIAEKKSMGENKPEKRVFYIMRGKYYLCLDPKKKTLYETSVAGLADARWIIRPASNSETKVTIYNEAAKNWIGVKNGKFIVHLMSSIDWELIRVN